MTSTQLLLVHEHMRAVYAGFTQVECQRTVASMRCHASPTTTAAAQHVHSTCCLLLSQHSTAFVPESRAKGSTGPWGWLGKESVIWGLEGYPSDLAPSTKCSWCGDYSAVARIAWGAAFYSPGEPRLTTAAVVAPLPCSHTAVYWGRSTMCQCTPKSFSSSVHGSVP
jgi:hypothetical protein